MVYLFILINPLYSEHIISDDYAPVSGIFDRNPLYSELVIVLTVPSSSPPIRKCIFGRNHFHSEYVEVSNDCAQFEVTLYKLTLFTTNVL